VVDTDEVVAVAVVLLAVCVPLQMYRQSGDGCVAAPVASAKIT
jgi:hypothetical protein